VVVWILEGVMDDLLEQGSWYLRAVVLRGSLGPLTYDEYMRAADRPMEVVLPNLKSPGKEGLQAILDADLTGHDISRLVDRLIFWESSPHGVEFWYRIYERGHLLAEECSELRQIIDCCLGGGFPVRWAASIVFEDVEGSTKEGM